MISRGRATTPQTLRQMLEFYRGMRTRISQWSPTGVDQALPRQEWGCWCDRCVGNGEFIGTSGSQLVSNLKLWVWVAVVILRIFHAFRWLQNEMPRLGVPELRLGAGGTNFSEQRICTGHRDRWASLTVRGAAVKRR